MFKLKDFEPHQRLFTYKVAFDGGSAPNPFYQVCTLAICKPKIRSVAKRGDVVLGLGCGDEESRIVYCMVVGAAVPWEKYIDGCRSGSLEVEGKIYKNLNKKIPRNTNDQGDCIWKEAAIYMDSLDSWSSHGGEDDFNRDVKNGKNVLIGDVYWYFGNGDTHKIFLSGDLKEIIPGRGHRSNSNDDFHTQFVEFFNNKLVECNIINFGMLGVPKYDPKKTDKLTCSRCRAEERDFDDAGENH